MEDERSSSASGNAKISYKRLSSFRVQEIVRAKAQSKKLRKHKNKTKQTKETNCCVKA